MKRVISDHHANGEGTRRLAPVRVVVRWLLVAACIAAANAGAQIPANPGLLNNWLREEFNAMKAWDIGGELRVRYTDSVGAVSAASFMTSRPAGVRPLTAPINPNTDFISNGQVNNNEELWIREKVHVGYSPVSWVTLYGEMRNNNMFWDERFPSPDANDCDLQQAYVQLGDPAEFPLIGKLGRQELIYGDMRFIGNAPWIMTGRVFDAAKLRYVTDTFWVDAFVGHVVVARDGHFNESSDYDWFSGVYASSQKILPWQETQFYVLSRNAGAQAVSAFDFNVPGTPTTARDIITAGFRLKSLPDKLGGWDYTLEAAGQCGSIYNTTLETRLDQQSYGVFAIGGYTWTNLWASPRLGAGYEGGSGDDNPTDGTSGTFENLFPANHRYYGQMDLFCQRNMHIPRLSLSLMPLKDLTITMDYLNFWLADTNDLLYPYSGSGRNLNGYGIHPTFDSYVGAELDVIARYTPKTWLRLEAGFGHFFVGDYIKQSVGSVAANGNAVDANWCYVQTTVSF